MEKFTLVNNRIITDNNKVLIQANNLNQLQELTSLLNDMQKKLDFDKAGCYSNYKLSEDFPKQKWNLIFIDVNNLKIVNDSHGHNRGDALLEKVATHLKKYGNVYRQGGDEFVLLYEDDTTTLKFEKENKHNNLFSYGIAHKNEYETISEAFHLADKRMYQKKKTHKEPTIEY